MTSLTSSEKGSEDSACAELPESDTPGPSSTSVGSEVKAQRDFFIHKVTKHDTLAGLAIRYGLSVYDLKKANGLASERGIYARETLVIPLHSSSDSGKMDESSQEWLGLSSVEALKKPFQPSTSRQPYPLYSKPYQSSSLSWNGVLDDPELRSVSEIELETIDNDRHHHQRNDVSRSFKCESFGESRRAYVPSSPAALMRPLPQKTATLSEYLTSMATSFIKTTEQLFSHPYPVGQPSKSATMFERLKKAASQTSLYDSLAGRAHGRQGEQMQGFGPKRGSESNLSGAKDVTKMD